jgi:excisionase family DNA binding protein
MSTTDACRYIGCGKTTLYALVKEKKLKLLKLGGKSLVLTSELDALIESLAKEAA